MSELPMKLPVSIKRAAQIECVEREIRLRRRVYPNWVAAGRLSPAKAVFEVECMEAVLETLRTLAGSRR